LEKELKMSVLCEDQELLEGFLAETTELLEKMDDDLIALEKAPDNMELMNSISAPSIR
jgi:two-component system chemotaxis sensor kinase CheA